MRRLAPVLALGILVVIHAVLTLYYAPPATVLRDRPIGGIDWELHYGQVQVAADAYARAGRTWAYDTQRLAGVPSGAISDADTKGWELWTIGLERLGVDRATAFNLFAWLAAFLVPLVVYAAARLFGLRPWTALGAAALGSACFFFDAQAHWCLWVGMLAWGFASYLWLLPCAVFWRWLSSRNPLWLLALLALLTVVLDVHPYAFFVLAVPLGVLYARELRRFGWREHVALVAVVVGTLVANLWWLRTALRFWHYVLDSGFYLDATLGNLATDYLGLTRDAYVTGVVAMRTGFRFLALGGAVLALWLWRRERDRRLLPFAATLGFLLGAAYLGGYLGLLRQVQPYRFALPAMYAAIIPAAVFLERGVVALRETKLPAAAWGVLGLALFVLVPRLARDVIYFVPEFIPRQARPLPAPPPDVNGGLNFGTVRWPDPFDFRLRSSAGDDLAAATDWVAAHDDGSSRWLVEWWMLGERLAWATRAQVLGGFREYNLAQSDANLFRRFSPQHLPTEAELLGYLEQYNVGWLIASNPLPRLESRPDLLRLEAVVFSHRIYRVLHPSGFIVGGGAGEVRAEPDRITVRDSGGGSMVLRFHWLETLRCRPGCTLRRVPVPGDRVGFIGVDHAPRDFEIFNAD